MKVQARVQAKEERCRNFWSGLVAEAVDEGAPEPERSEVELACRRQDYDDRHKMTMS